jgi:zinc/manganese transport system permease protein
MVTADILQLGDMLSHDFMRNALLAGTAIAAACGLVSYFIVLRGQVFTGDAFSHVAFTGALAALAFGIDLRVGLFAAVIAVAMLIGALGDRGTADDVVIGSVFAWILGLGVLFLSLFTTHRSTTNSTAGVSVLFGSIFGLDHDRTLTALAIAVGVCVALLAIARPLLFATVDLAVAAARGLPVRGLGLGFLVLVGISAGEATQAIGALLLIALLAAPGAAAQRLTTQPYRGLLLSALLAIASMWAGLTVSFWVPKLPPSFTIVAALVLVYAAAALTANTAVTGRSTGTSPFLQ